MNTRENRYNVGIQNKRGHPRPTRFNLIAGLMSGIMQPVLERKKKEREREKSMNITGYAIAKEY